MRIRVVEVDGTPEELLRVPQLVDALGPRAANSGKVPNPVNGKLDVDADVQELIDGVPPGPRRARVERVMEHLLALPGVHVLRGRSKKRPDGRTSYARFHREHNRVGAFAYLKPGVMALDLRLPEKAAARAEHARARRVGRKHAYQVRAPLTNEAAVEEALRLAEAAYDAAE